MPKIKFVNDQREVWLVLKIMFSQNNTICFFLFHLNCQVMEEEILPLAGSTQANAAKLKTVDDFFYNFAIEKRLFSEENIFLLTSAQIIFADQINCSAHKHLLCNP